MPSSSSSKNVYVISVHIIVNRFAICIWRGTVACFASTSPDPVPLETHTSTSSCNKMMNQQRQHSKCWLLSQHRFGGWQAVSVFIVVYAKNLYSSSPAAATVQRRTSQRTHYFSVHFFRTENSIKPFRSSCLMCLELNGNGISRLHTNLFLASQRSAINFEIVCKMQTLALVREAIGRLPGRLR